jgi:hypothetical protein
MTPWPTKQSSPTVTSSQMKACDWIRQRLPIETSFWISTNGPTNVSSPISHPYTLHGSTITTPSPKRQFTMPVAFLDGSFNFAPRACSAED